MTRLPRHSRGFTLLEVVIALTLTATLLVVVYNAIHLGLRAQREVISAVHRNDELRAFTYFLRRQFRHVDTTVRNETLRFSGDRHNVRCALRGFRGDPSVYLLNLQAVPRHHPRNLVATIQRVDARSGRPAATVLQAEIGRGLGGVSFEFYGAPGGRNEEKDTPTWQSLWRPGAHPPRLIRVRYFQDNQHARTLYLSVAGADGNQVAGYATGVAGL